MSKLLSQGGFGCVYHPGINCDGGTEKDQNIVTKLQQMDFNAQNEIDIGTVSYTHLTLPTILLV